MAESLLVQREELVALEDVSIVLETLGYPDEVERVEVPEGVLRSDDLLEK